MPSRVTAGSVLVACSRSSSILCRSCTARNPSRVGAVGSTTSRPPVPSTTTSDPGGTRRTASCRPATAGIPKDRARIAVWCVGEPASMVTARTRSQSSSAASEGVRSSVTSTKLPGRRESEGASVAPPRLIWMRPRTSSRSVLRSRR